MKMAISSIDLQTAIGKRIAGLRKARGMGQLELCGELDVSVKHLSECERGVSMFSLERLLDICEIFDVSLDYLVRGLPTDDPQLNFPPTMVEIFHSRDEQEIALLTEYLNMYSRLRTHPGSDAGDAPGPDEPNMASNKMPKPQKAT